MLGLASHRGQYEKSPDAEHGAIVYGNEAMLALHPQPDTDLAECCGANTPPASLSNASRGRPTTNVSRFFVTTADASSSVLREHGRSVVIGPALTPISRLG